MFIKPVADQFTAVPMLNLHVFRIRYEGMGYAEATQTELESYYLTPDEAVKGQAAHKMSFQEAISRFIF